MLRFRDRGFILISLFILLFLGVSNAYAYLDPGTGSLIVQVLIASAVSALFAIKIFWKRLTAFFRKVFHKETAGPSEDGHEKA